MSSATEIISLWAIASRAVRPGDTVVVPLDTERMPAPPCQRAVTSITCNLAIAAAAINSF